MAHPLQHRLEPLGHGSVPIDRDEVDAVERFGRSDLVDEITGDEDPGPLVTLDLAR